MTLRRYPQLSIVVNIGLIRQNWLTGESPTNSLSQRRIQYFERILVCSKNMDK